MIGGDELSVVLAIIGLGISFALAGLSQTGWKNKWLIRSLFGLGSVSVLAALTWPIWKKSSPQLASVIIQVSTSPVAWFGLLLFTLAAYLFSWKTKSALEAYVSRLTKDQRASAEPRSAWKEALVAAGSADIPAHLRFHFAENGRNARLYVDFSVFHPAVTATHWTKQVRLEVKRFDHFARDQSVRVDLFEQVGGSGSLFWRLAYITETNDKVNPRYVLAPNSSCRGRYTLLTEDNRESHCYFIAEPTNGVDGPPRVTGQHMFSHAWDWEREA